MPRRAIGRIVSYSPMAAESCTPNSPAPETGTLLKHNVSGELWFELSVTYNLTIDD